jgi:hypothetical protein
MSRDKEDIENLRNETLQIVETLVKELGASLGDED